MQRDLVLRNEPGTIDYLLIVGDSGTGILVGVFTGILLTARGLGQHGDGLLEGTSPLIVIQEGQNHFLMLPLWDDIILGIQILRIADLDEPSLGEDGDVHILLNIRQLTVGHGQLLSGSLFLSDQLTVIIQRTLGDDIVPMDVGIAGNRTQHDLRSPAAHIELKTLDRTLSFIAPHNCFLL